jgi:transposase
VAGYLAPVWRGEQALSPLHRPQQGSTLELIAEGFEQLEPLTAVVAGAKRRWTERRLAIRSSQLAQAGERGLHARLAKAQAAGAALNEHRRGKRRPSHLTALQAAVDEILARYQVQGLLQVRSAEHVWERPLRRDGNRPATVRVERDVWVTAGVDQEAVEAAVRRRGWRGYATNAPAEQLSLPQAVLAYRSEYLIERDMGHLKGKPLSLTPMDLERDDHATGLIRLLSIGLRVLTLLEFVVRRRLKAAGSQLAGLYAGNPQRATAQPTAERLLEAFHQVTLTIIREGRKRRHHLTPLSSWQQRILRLLDLPPAIYTRLCADSHTPL